MPRSPTSTAPPTPARFFALVTIGGGLGALARHGALRADVVEPSTVVLLVNVVGSAVLGALLAWLRPGSESRPHRTFDSADVAALLGTGFCGGLTTFSTHMVDVAQRLGSSPLEALMSLLSTVLLAVVAAAGGHVGADRLTSARRTKQIGSRP